MPIYVYECPHCRKIDGKIVRVEQFRKPSEVNDPPPDCSRCEATDGPGTGTPMVQVISAPASTFPGASSWRSR